MKILIVDDEPEIREELTEFVNGLGFDVACAANGEEALTKFFSDAEISIILTDLTMPGITGLEMLEGINVSPESEGRIRQVIFMTGNGDTQSVIKAMHLGATEFLLKPVDLEQLEANIRVAEQHVADEQARRLNEEEMAEKVHTSALEITALNQDVERAYEEALTALATTAEYKDPETGRHITRIGEYSAALASKMGWSDERVEMLRMASALHDVGKVGIPDAILLKPDPLDDEEIKVMQRHSELGYGILARSSYPVMAMAAQIALCHHERWDGSGYPRGLKGTQIPMEAAITALCDVYDALRSERPYKGPMSHEKVTDIIVNGDGRTRPEHFCPEVLGAFTENEQVLAEIYERWKDVDVEPVELPPLEES